ncbi:hypothetical protein TRIP_C21628 [Candidatus Zixiibacteriota bacterium]|nr:hypothetical protein TRIP_C21628 [candidate division Zixibacteria bacterium]
MDEKNTVVRRRPPKSRLIESPLFIYGLKFAIGFVVVLIFLTLTQCTINKPESPSWSTHLTLPLVNKTYEMPEIIRRIDQPGLSLDSSGDVMFTVDKDLDTVRVSDNLSTSDITVGAGETLGDVAIAPPSPDPLTVALADYTTLNLGAVPPGSFDIQQDYPPVDNYSWATVASGTLALNIENNFGVDLDTVIVQLYDIVYSRIVSTNFLPAPGLPSGGAETLLVDLTGQTISNSFRLNIHCHTPGGTMLSLSDKSMTAGLAFSDGLNVSAAQAEIPQIVKDFSQNVVLSENNTIMTAQLSSGNLALDIANRTNLTSHVQITLPDFNQGGVPYSTNVAVNPQSSGTVNINLADYLFEPADQTSPQNIGLEVHAIIDSTAPGMVTVSQTDSVSVSASVSNLQFRTMTGIIDSTEASFDGIQTSIDLPKGFDSLQLVSAVLTLEIANAVDFPGGLNITLEGNNGRTLNLSGPVLAGCYDNPIVSVISNSDLASFLNPVPSAITVHGSAYFGDGVTVGTVTAQDYVASHVHISSPLEAVIGQTTFDGDMESNDVKQDDIDKITDHVLEANFLATIINHLPLGVTAEIYLSGDSSTLYTDPQLVIGPISVDAGVTGLLHTVDSAVTSENIIALDSADIQILKNPVIYSGQVITLNGTDGQPVKVVGDDYVTARGVIQVEYHFDGKF